MVSNASSRTTPRPLFYSPSPTPKSAEPAPGSPTSPLSRRRTQLSPRTSAKRSPAGSKLWTRRLDFGAGPPLPAATSADPSPSKAALSSGDQAATDSAFNMSALAEELDEIEATPPKFQSRLFASAHSLRPPVKAPATINDLPDEILLRIFGFLDDQLGYRALPTRVPGLPEWSSPPLRISRVCKRWLPLARFLCYRSLRIAHLSRISALYRAFRLNPELATHVRHLVISLPAMKAEELEQVPHLVAGTGQTDGRAPPAESEADPQSRPATPLAAGDSPTKSTRKKQSKAEPPTYADQLRTVFQSCAFLLSLEVVGVPPATLFAASASSGPTLSSLSSLHRLHQLRLSTVVSLTLRAPDDSEPLKAVALRDALLALTGLRRLALKGYASALKSDDNDDDDVTRRADRLDFAPTKTLLGNVARPLPLRTRSSRQLPLERLELVECSFSPADLAALLRQCRPKSLRQLIVEDRYTSARAAQLRTLGYLHAPTVEALLPVVDLVKDSLIHLKVSLYNYPLLVDGNPPVATSAFSGTAVANPPAALSSTASRGNRRVVGQRAPRHVLDDFVAQLENLKVLDVGGTVLTPALFEAYHPTPIPTPTSTLVPAPTTSRLKPAAARLPPSVRTLTIRASPLLTPSALLPFLSSLGPLASRVSDPTVSVSRLQAINTIGGSEHGWSRSTNAWSIQQACWDAGVKWISGASSALIGPEDKHIVEIDCPKYWVQGYGPASRTGGAW
ncbi:hypothetical protein JCM3774_003119 [Rhodotorula dairenensis]